MSQFTGEQLEVVKHVMFGLQKQANVINDAVVKIIARGIVDFNGDVSCLSSEQTFTDTVVKYLNDAVEKNGATDETLLMLIAGEKSLATAKADGPKIVTHEKLSEDSPKFNFRIVQLGLAEVDDSYEVSNDSSGKVEIGAYKSSDLTYREQAEQLKNEIIPLAPKAMRDEISDNDYMLALCAAPYYFSI